MTVFQRVATFATIFLGLIVGIGVSTPGLATEIDRSALPLPVAVGPAINTLTTIVVPPLPEIVIPAAAPATSAAEDEDFASLSDAVAAQDRAVTDDQALRCLAGAVYFESKGEPLAGQLAVAEVIINRAKSGRFPEDICDVVTQRGQFAFVRRGAIPSVDTARASYRTALAVAQVALADAWDSPAPKALFFHARGVRPGWGKTRIASIGNHVFYR